MRQAANEAAFLKSGDETVDARFRAKVERFLPFIEARGDAALLDPLMNEHQQFVLLARQHRFQPLMPSEGRKRPSEQNKNALSCSSLVLGNLSSAIVDKSGAKGQNRNNITGLGGRGLRRAHHETARARKHEVHGPLLNRVGRGERKLPWHMVEGSADVVLADAIGGKCGAESGEGECLRRLTALKAGNGGLQEKRCADQRRYRISRQAEQGQITKPP